MDSVAGGRVWTGNSALKAGLVDRMGGLFDAIHSALLSTTMYMMKDVIEAIDREGLHANVKIMVGGAPLNDDYAKKIGADFYGPDCIAGRDYARSVVAHKN